MRKKPAAAALPDIPYIDLRGQNMADLVRGNMARAHHLVDTIAGMAGAVSRTLTAALFPLTDRITRNWLRRTGNPYRGEIDAIAKTLGRSGVHTLNLCYEWGCTTAVLDGKDGPVLARVLDWPFPAMGESMVVARQSGPAGEFDNITWPGMAGVFNAVAKDRFAAALNQAPMRRHRLTMAGDWLRNRHLFRRQKGLPPAHLLRKTLEEARSYAEARDMLAATPVSIPTLYILSGTKPGEGCVIERTETSAVIRDMQQGHVSVTNHFQSAIAKQDRWKARRTCSTIRAQAATQINPAEVNQAFDWFTAPIANEYSRLVFNAEAATGRLELMGTQGPAPATKVFIKP